MNFRIFYKGVMFGAHGQQGYKAKLSIYVQFTLKFALKLGSTSQIILLRIFPRIKSCGLQLDSIFEILIYHYRMILHRAKRFNIFTGCAGCPQYLVYRRNYTVLCCTPVRTRHNIIEAQFNPTFQTLSQAIGLYNLTDIIM
ncbi:hypothetical protein FGO68_gene6762 [Halteria grandinella]|uniref:Uncharacterized protein n=1 Tax=Halteria grandinella TaxID=5974 RepID=A0A8J8NH41_HALGN|nr:hypothetical protein FGO68_gene6762 [Halteria grandinella]